MENSVVFHFKDLMAVEGRLTVKIAISLPSLIRETNAFSLKHSPGCQASLADSNPKNLFLHYNVVCHESYSDPAGHDVRVQFLVEKLPDVAPEEARGLSNVLDVQCSCSCPAFLYWAAQWNLHKRDGLLGAPRPLLQAPKERLDLRGNFVICKHCYIVFSRILPSVQHNIINILRERLVKIRKEKAEEAPEKLNEKQEEMKKRKEIEKIKKVKDRELQDKMMEALREKEEKRLLHEHKLDEKDEEEPVVEREGPAVGADTGKKEEPEATPAWMKLPAVYEESGEEEAIGGLLEEEEAKIEKQHEEGPPHLHKGLPYETEEEDTIKRKFESLKPKELKPGTMVRARRPEADFVDDQNGVVERIRPHTKFRELKWREQPSGAHVGPCVELPCADITVRWEDGSVSILPPYMVMPAQRSLLAAEAE